MRSTTMPAMWTAEKPTTSKATRPATVHQRRSHQAPRSRSTPIATSGASAAITATLVSSQNSGLPSS